MRFSMRSDNGKFAVLLFLLAVENVWIFHGHYFAGFVFPWDFFATYHAFTYYWIEAAKLGVSLDWIPFQAMGYPAYLNLQSALFYPPMWLLVALDLDYSLSVAVVMQCLHVGFGGVGAAVCARLMGLGWRASLLAGVFYQGFGGFYSNSEHVDIVRTYALLPWLACVVFADWDQSSKWLKPLILMQPLLVYCLWTGGYPGGAIAVLFVLGTVAAARTAWCTGRRSRGIGILFCYGIGCALAGPFLLPPVMEISEFARSSLREALDYDYMAFSDIFSLIYPVDKPYSDHDISMRSTFIGIPALALLMWGGVRVRRCNPWIAMSVLLSVAVASGFLHQILAPTISPLGFSRFVFADYRGIIALGLILIACRFFDEFPGHQRGGLWVLLLLLFVLIGNQVMQLNYTKLEMVVETVPFVKPQVWQLLAIIFCVAALFFFALKSHPRLSIAGIFVLFLLDWSRVHRGQEYFGYPANQARFEYGIGKLEETQARLRTRLQEGVRCRPARTDIPRSRYSDKPWRGYYTGDYMMEDYAGPMHLLRQQNIWASPALRSFALQPWRAISFEPGVIINPQMLSLSGPSTVMTCIHYGVSDISYRVNAAGPVLVMENEMYAKGWQARLFNDQDKQVDIIDAQDIYGLRAWILPPGQFRMEATYQTPHIMQGYVLASLGCIAWLLVVFAPFFRKINKR